MTKYMSHRGVAFDSLGIHFTYDEKLTKATLAPRPDSGTNRIYSADLDAKQVTALKKLSDEVLEEYAIVEAPLTAEEKQAEKAAAEQAAAEKKAADEKAAAEKAAAAAKP